MAPQTGTAILVLAAFVLPGFVTFLPASGPTTCARAATLEDGRLVGGFFGDRSTAGRHADRHDIYLEERWMLDGDGWFTGAQAAGTRGIYLPASAITSLELYDHHGDRHAV